jgi:hypothetical protein
MDDRSNVRRIIGQDIESIITDFLDTEVQDKLEGFYVGKIVDNKDPDKKGRCKVKVYGIFDGVPNDDLPWAMPDFNFIGSTMGSFVVPPINTIVRIYFDNNDIYLPHYSTKVIEESKLSSLRLENYPDTMILFETDEGDYLTMNRKTKKFVFHHNSGNNVEIDRAGNTDILIKSNKDQTVNGNEVHLVKGDHTIKNSNVGLIKIDRMGNVTIDGLNVKIDHDIMLEVTGKVVTPTGSGPLNALPTDPVTGIPHSGTICF